MRATKPLVVGGSIIRGLEVEFREGRAVRIDAEEGAEVLRGYAARDEGAARLGEVALVDGEGASARSTRSSSTRCSTRTPPRHIALGRATVHGGEEDDRASTSP